jgi:glutamate dehydrogenase
MAVVDEKNPPQFYSDYVKEVHRIIEENARLEFECIWKASSETKTPKSVLSDQLSNKINELSHAISNSNLWDNIQLRKKVFEAAVPQNLMKLLGFETMMQRVPLAYAKAMFGTYLASRYVYQCGLNSNPEFAFYNFLSEKTK